MGKSGYFSSSSYASAPIWDIPTGDNSRFMECWFKINYNVTTRTALLGYGVAGYYFSVHLESNGRIRLGIDASIRYSPTYAYSLGVWNHVGIGYSGSYLYIYLNGSIVYTSPLITSNYATKYSALQIGAPSTGVLSPSCLIDNIRVYNRCISLSEFNKSHKVTNGLLCGYNFNLDTGVTIYDILGRINGSWVNSYSLSTESVDFDRYVLRHNNASTEQWVSGLSLTPITLTNIDQVITTSPNSYLPYIQTGDRILRII